MNLRNAWVMSWLCAGVLAASAAWAADAPSSTMARADAPKLSVAKRPGTRAAKPAASGKTGAKRAASSPSAAAPTSGAPKAKGPEAPRTLQDIHIEGEIPVPQVLFITARDQRRFLDFQHRRYLKTSQQVGEQTVFPSWIGVTGNHPTPAGKENPQ